MTTSDPGSIEKETFDIASVVDPVYRKETFLREGLANAFPLLS